MTALEQIQAYLRQLTWRMRVLAAARGVGASMLVALALTLLLAAVANRYEFSRAVVTPLRVLLYAAVAAALAGLLAWPVSRLRRRRIVETAEERAPGFKQRLLTLADKHDNDPWTELLAEDALTVAAQHTAVDMVQPHWLWGAVAGAAAVCAVLLWVITSAPGYWGYGAQLLWLGHADAQKRPLYAITVTPGDRTIRRKSDQTVEAHLDGFSAATVVMHARYGNAAKWDAVTMEPASTDGSYRFVFAGVNEPVEYYVQASHSQSRHYLLNVKDLPMVQRLRVKLRYPAELGLENAVFDPGGDIRSVKGTEAEIDVETDRPLERGVLVMNNRTVPLVQGEGHWLHATVPVESDGTYHIAAVDGSETIRISEDYFIEAKKDEPPAIRIAKPGQDPHVSPIEELPVTLTASDDYGLGALELHYAVNGGAEKTLPLLKVKGSKEAEAKTMVAFEDLQAKPGDMVALYGVARDAHSVSRSDIIFAQADGFDYRFSQSQQSGGMGGGGQGNEASEISQRQKQIIAATFNQVKQGTTGSAMKEDAKFLAEEQAKLAQQATTMAERMASRELGAAGGEFEQFAKLLTQAAGDMHAASGQLNPGRWNDALPPEQKALTSLLRAEALFRDIQISQSRGGGGGGQNQNAGRDLARMFDLELDTSKNQYETQQGGMPQQQANQEKLDKARQKLEELARRQQELAKQQGLKTPAAEQRWQEEQLRREAEELRRQLQEMAQNGERSQQGQQGQQGQQQSAQNGAPQSGSQQAGSQQSGSQQAGSQQAGSQQMRGQYSGREQQSAFSQQASQQFGQQSGQAGAQRNGAGQKPSAQERAAQAQTAQAAREAMRALQQAEDEMRNAVSRRDGTATARAQQRLQEAQRSIAQAMQQQAGGTVSDLAGQAEQLAQAQQGAAQRMKEMYGAGAGTARERFRAFANSGDGDPNAMPEMSDPASSRYGMRRRWSGLYQPTPARPANDRERALADEKEKLAAQVEGLQRQMHQQAQALADARPDAAAKLMRALSDVEGKELALRMQKNAEWLRQGFGDRNVGMEDSVTAGLQQMSRALRDVQTTLNAPDPAGEARGLASEKQGGTRTLRHEDAPEGYKDAVAGYFKKLSQGK